MLGATLPAASDYAPNGPLVPPEHFTLHNFTGDFHNGFGQYFLNTLVVTACVVGIVLLLVPPLAYAIVRSRGRTTSASSGCSCSASRSPPRP